MNPMLNQLNGAGSLAKIKQLFGTIKAAQNPQAMMENMMRGNPQFQQAQELVSASGGDARAAFYKLAQEKGIDPEQILSALR